MNTVPDPTTGRAERRLAEHRRQVAEADRRWRELGQAVDGGSAEGWNLAESEVQR